MPSAALLEREADGKDPVVVVAVELTRCNLEAAANRHADSFRQLPPRKRSEGETTTDCRSKVVVGVIGDAGAMRNGDGQTAAHVGICNSGKRVETLGEVMIQIERPLIRSEEHTSELQSLRHLV